MTTIGLQRWHGFIKSQDQAELWDLLHPDVVFESPVVHRPQRGRDITFKYLTSATKVLGGPTFSYVGEWTSDTGAVLEFTSDVDGITMHCGICSIPMSCSKAPWCIPRSTAVTSPSNI